MKINKISFNDRYQGNDIEKLYRNQAELGEKINEMIDLLNTNNTRSSTYFDMWRPNCKIDLGDGFTALTCNYDYESSVCIKCGNKLLGKIKLSETKPPKDFSFISSHNGCSVKCTVHHKSGRITIDDYGAGTKLDFRNRRVNTIEGLAKCMLEAVEHYKKWEKENGR